MQYNTKLITLLVINIFVFIFSIFSETGILMVISGINIAISIWGKDKEKIAMDNYVFLIMGIVNLFCLRLLSAGFFLNIQWNLKKKYRNSLEKVKNENKVDPQIRKIDILLKLGVAMIFIAGFVFATTGWYSLSSILKIFIFLLIACLFIGLSKFCEEKIGIKSTIYLYWILGMSFIILMFLTAGYSAVFGDYFSLIGDGELLYISFCSLIVSVLGLISYYNFNDKTFLYLVYSAIVLSIMFLSESFGLVTEEILMLLVPVVTIIKISKMNKEKDFYTLSIFSDILLLVLGIIFICFIGSYTNVFAVVALSILFIFNIYSYIYTNRESDLNAFASILSYVLLIPSLILLLDDNSCLWVVITIFFITLLYLISLSFGNEKLKNSSLVTADIITILVFFISINGPIWLPLFVSLFSIFVCFICTVFDNLDKYKIEVFVHPVKISMLLFSIIFLLNKCFILTSVMGYWLSSTLLLYILIYCLSRRKVITDIYEKFSIVAVIIALIFTTAIPNFVISIVIFVSIVLFYAEVNWAREVQSNLKNFIFVLLLFNILISMKAIENSLMLENTSYLFSNIVSIVLFILVGIFHRNDNFKLNLSLFAVIVPIISLIETYVNIDWVSIILPSIFVYYLTFIISRVINNNVAKNIVGYVGYSYAFLLVIFSSNYYVLAYSFILIIISLLFGYYDKTYNALFKVSVVALVVEILYQLKEFWNLIPAWLYLLIVGIILIVFATYKQLKIIDNKKDKK